jgi:hypothetical protein
MMLQLLQNVKAALEYASGVTEDPPFARLDWMKSPLWWGVWWAILIVAIVAFSGQSSKFIYIDF